MENRRLKKEAVGQDDKFKQTAARLARAEEAAKRAALASDAPGVTRVHAGLDRVCSPRHHLQFKPWFIE
jgi:hypothetical protein